MSNSKLDRRNFEEAAYKQFDELVSMCYHLMEMGWSALRVEHELHEALTEAEIRFDAKEGTLDLSQATRPKTQLSIEDI